MHKRKICFVSLDSYPVLKSGINGHFGGAQVQQVLIAKWLVNMGWEVSFITANSEQPKKENISGIRIIKAYEPNEGIRFIRFLYPRLTGICKALKRADCRIYYQRSAGFLTGVVGVFCKLMRRQFVFATSSDFNVDKGFSLTGKKRDIVLYHLGLKLADRIFVQSTYQQRLLETNYGLFSKIVPNAIEMSDSAEIETKKEFILWVGNLYRLKQPEVFIKLASKLREQKFVIVGSMKDEKTYQEYVRKIMDENANITYIGQVAHNHIISFYDKAYCLVNTSKYEGFSNTFLEAWRNRIPVISLNSNPDKIITKYKLGFVANSFDKLFDYAVRLIEDSDLRTEMGRNGYNYVKDNFSANEIADMYDHQLRNVQ